ncbi:DUF4350 domain-containing protein [Tautonia sociabilis]|uniref:DUF4350 domain-containing protein n=1 Tax=Tautonia sociabilis TaxID=2080755 RepID=A0A432MGU8_9BACT|nr:DUF4350 domain-containing protein [Tautonia sociabilis]RUL86170.1 DUF4350 domain-containing protein [Tautonia sociabilis]
MIASGHGSRILALVAMAAALSLSGCGEERIETEYGRMRGRSVNGTGAFAELLRGRGHEVRAARRLNDELAGWADTIVRFAPEPGPIERDEADWYLDWQLSGLGRRLIFVCRDGGAEAEYWAAALSSLPADAPRVQRDRILRKLGEAGGWGSDPAPPDLEPAEAQLWFSIDSSRGLTASASTLDGPWAEGVDPAAANVPINRAIEQTSETEMPLLVGDGRILAMDWVWEMNEGTDPSAVLVLANGSFLLNAAIVPKARRSLTLRVAEWAGSTPRKVAFVEGPFVFGAQQPLPTPWEVIRQVPELGMVAGHFLAFALAAALSRAVLLGRPRPAPSIALDRPSAHAEALGHLLARVGASQAARSILASYRRWRRPQRAVDARTEPDSG